MTIFNTITLRVINAIITGNTRRYANTILFVVFFVFGLLLRKYTIREMRAGRAPSGIKNVASYCGDIS